MIRVVRSDERIDGVLQWLVHVERMENDKIVKRVCRSVLVVAQWVARGRDLYHGGMFKGKRFGCQESKENGAG